MKMPAAEDRHARLREIETLDPVKDCVRVYWLFTQDFRAAQTFSGHVRLFATYAAPRISRILDDTGELRDRVQKRLVDSFLIDGAYHEHGFASGPGRDAIRRMNQMHGKYDIHPDDFILNGCFEVVCLIWYAERFGWRPVTAKERTAAVEFAKQRGRYMGSKPYPNTLEEMEAFCAKWFGEQLRFEPQNKSLADAMLGFMARELPASMRPMMRSFLLSVTPDERLMTGCGYRMPGPRARALSRRLMRLYGKLDPMPDGPLEVERKLVASVYPGGYDINRLGTHLEMSPAADAGH